MKNLFKRILATLLVLTFVFTVVGCGSVTKDESTTTTTDNSTAVADSTKEQVAKTPTVAVLIPGPVGYFTAVRTGLDAAAKQYNIKIEYADANWDASKQLSQVEDFVSKKVDMIAICSVDAEAVKPAIKIANEANIPIMAFTNAVGTDPSGKYEGLVTYVGQNEVKSGEVCGNMAKELLGTAGGNVVMIEGQPGTPPQRNRREGFMNAIKDQANIKEVYKQTGKWSTDEAMKIVEDLIQKKMDMKLIFAQDDNMAIGAGKALKEAGLKDKVFVIGLGGSIAGLQGINDGLLDRTTYMAASDEGFKAIEACAKFLKGEKLEPVIEMVQVPVTKETSSQFKGEW